MSKKDIDKSSVALYLEPKDRNKVFYACLLFLFYLTSIQSGLTILQTPMLTKMNMIEQFSIVTIAGTIGTAIMTPIGGKIGDIIGRKNTILIFGTIALIANVLLSIMNSFNIYISLRFLIALALGAIVSVPYILVGQIYPREESPKRMGLLASSIALGSFSGAMIAGFLDDKGLTMIAILYPIAFLLIALFLIVSSLPNIIPKVKAKLDIIGMILLTIFLISLVLTLNYGTILGWTNTKILGGLALCIISLILFVTVENKMEKGGKNPLISLSLFKNIEYSILLIIGFSAYYYQTMMFNYGALGAINIMGTSAGLAGFLTFPRTIVTLILPVIVGAWVGKKLTNSWKAIAIATGVVAIALLPILKIDSKMSVIVMIASFTVTGIADSFRGVSITPAAQALLKPENLATGTALLNFINTLASVFAAAIGGSLMGYSGGNNELGIKLVFLSAIIVALIGFLLTIFYIRPRQINRSKDMETE